MYLVGTPAGMNNIFYEYYLKAQGNKDWFLYTAKANETKILEQAELDNALEMLGQAKFNQEFLCSFLGNQPGSIFGKEISDLDDKENITKKMNCPKIS